LGILNAVKVPDITITNDEKESTKEAIISGAFKLMERIVTGMSPKNRARKRSGTHRQSNTGLTRSYTIFNILKGKQKLPVRPNDFKLDLPEDQRIPRWEWKSVLTSLVRGGLLQNRRDRFPYPRGRPIKESLGVERRGHPGYYEESRLKKMVDVCINDPRILEEINNSILRSDLFYKFLKYSFQTHLYQIQFDENSFKRSNRTVIQEYGIQEKVKLGLGY
jgi:hypothetical protein